MEVRNIINHAQKFCCKLGRTISDANRVHVYRFISKELCTISVTEL